MTTNLETAWHPTACILCSLNCGLLVQTGGHNGRELLRIKGDKAHPVSRGYVCEKAQRLNFYQNSEDRLTSPLRRKPDGTFEPISWDTAIREIADRFMAIKRQYGGDKILFYGGGGQGNHLGGTYATNTLTALGNRYRSNALAQEKTGEFWVNGKMIGAGIHGDFEHCEVALFIGKNPWQSHGFARARATLQEIIKDPQRSLIVIDPCRTETAEKADYHLAVKPGADAWCLAALVAILIQEQRIQREWVAQHTLGFEHIEPLFRTLDIARYAAICGVDEALLRTVARRIAEAESVAVFEDLGMQMNRHSTLSSWLQRLIWLLTGHYAKPGGMNAFTPLLSLGAVGKGESVKGAAPADPKGKVSPVAGAKIIIGLIPCNVIPEEILTDHPHRYRAMLIESGNPAHSLADSQKMREALRALDLVVVIDVAMTETAREAHYILPAASQFEKCEATYFNLEFPRNAFHLRHRLFEPLPGTLPEPEIHARLLAAMGVLRAREVWPLRLAAKFGRKVFAAAFFAAMAINKNIGRYAQSVLYRALGPTLPEGLQAAAVYWGVAHRYVRANRKAAARAGFGGSPFAAGEKLFDAILDSPSGVVFADNEYADSWLAVRRPEHRIKLDLTELRGELEMLNAAIPATDPEFPFILSAGERRTDTTNTIIRNPGWDAKNLIGKLRIHPRDAEQLGCEDGSRIRVRTKRGSAEAVVELSERMQPGHVSLPNGQGMDYQTADGRLIHKGVAPNELTDCAARDFLAGTPWHKSVPARLERVSAER